MKLFYNDCKWHQVCPIKRFYEEGKLDKSGLIFAVNGFVDRESKVGKIYQKYKNKSVFYRVATFFSVKETLFYSKKVGFKNFIFVQNIFNTLDKIKKEEPIRNGYREGSFVVIRSQK